MEVENIYIIGDIHVPSAGRVPGAGTMAGLFVSPLHPAAQSLQETLSVTTSCNQIGICM